VTELTFAIAVARCGGGPAIAKALAVDVSVLRRKGCFYEPPRPQDVFY
jgi:hypothetical protein